MKNFIQDGTRVKWTNGTGSDVASGDVVVLGAMIAIACEAIANGAAGTLATEGVFTVPKTAGSAIAQGDAAIFDESAGAFVPSTATPASGDVSGAVICWEAASSAATTVKVKINANVGTVA